MEMRDSEVVVGTLSVSQVYCQDTQVPAFWKDLTEGIMGHTEEVCAPADAHTCVDECYCRRFTLDCESAGSL